MRRRRRKRGDKKKAQMKHAHRRASERLGLNLAEHEFNELIGQIRSGRAKFLERQSLRITKFMVTLPNGEECPVVYDRQRKTIVTFLKKEWVENDQNDASRIQDVAEKTKEPKG